MTPEQEAELEEARALLAPHDVAVAAARGALNDANATARDAGTAVKALLPDWDAARAVVKELERKFHATTAPTQTLGGN